MKNLVAILVLLISMPVFAHDREAAGFLSGFFHPLLGPDHLLAMLAVGLVSARIAGHFIWTIPVIFVTFMVAGGALGANGFVLPFVEFGIALSVLVLGLANALVIQTNLLLKLL